MTFEIPKPGMPIMIEVGGRKLELRFSLRTLKALEKDLKISVLQGAGLTQALRDPEILTDFLWYGLRTKNADLSREWVEDEFDASMLMTLVPILAYAVTGSDISHLMPKGSTIPNGTGPATMTGSNSGQSDVTTYTVQSDSSGL